MSKQSTYEFSLESVNVPKLETNYRTIKTAIPHQEDINTIKDILRLESSLLEKQLPIVWDRAEGFQVYDRWGNRWIDLSSTIFVANSGHSNPLSKKRTLQIIEKGLMHAYCYPTQERADFLKQLIKMIPPYLERACLVSTGTEASERAIKLARLYGMNHSPRKKVIIGGIGNYHGKTMGAMMSAVNPDAREWIGYQDPNMRQMPFPTPWDVEKSELTGTEIFEKDIKKIIDEGINEDEVAAFIIESYQGWGALFYPVDYIQAMQKWAKEHQALIIVDEIQAGFGRTGKLFGYQHYGIEPDLVCCGKGISGSAPLSAVLGKGELIELDPTLTSTHGGNPVSCAAALGNLEYIEQEGLVERSADMSQDFYRWLVEWKNKFPHRITHILGNGMVWAVFICKSGSEELDPEFADRLCERALQKGVFSIRTGCGTIKFGPPLTIDRDALKEAIDVYIESMQELIDEK
jgi:4-aminobutyrate aminotransferase / (S)-3-amino-2-methylpropionate transaminase / 5-aminovalerate transaminase